MTSNDRRSRKMNAATGIDAIKTRKINIIFLLFRLNSLKNKIELLL
jgi:hypothetical protein